MEQSQSGGNMTQSEAVGHIVTDIVDNEKEFKWRLRNTETGEASSWNRYYPVLCIHTFENGETWAYATDYWKGVLPTEKPFQIISEGFVAHKC